MRHPNARTIPAAFERASAGGALRHARRIRGVETDRDEARISSRRIRSSRPQFLSCMGARSLNIPCPSPLDCNLRFQLIVPIERSLVRKVYKVALDSSSVTVAFFSRGDVNDQHRERKINENAGPRDVVGADDEKHRNAETRDSRV